MIRPFLVRRALQICALVFVLLTAIEFLEGERLGDALAYAAVWSVASAAVFAVAQEIRQRRGASCAMCEEDAPDAPGREQHREPRTDEEKATVLFQ